MLAMVAKKLKPNVVVRPNLARLVMTWKFQTTIAGSIVKYSSAIASNVTARRARTLIILWRMHEDAMVSIPYFYKVSKFTHWVETKIVMAILTRTCSAITTWIV
jgi:hypothetical protein